MFFPLRFVARFVTSVHFVGAVCNKSRGIDVTILRDISNPQECQFIFAKYTGRCLTCGGIDHSIRYYRQPFTQFLCLRTPKLFGPSGAAECARDITGRVSPIVPTVAVRLGSRLALEIIQPHLDPRLHTMGPTTRLFTPRRR